MPFAVFLPQIAVYFLIGDIVADVIIDTDNPVIFAVVAGNNAVDVAAETAGDGVVFADFKSFDVYRPAFFS